MSNEQDQEREPKELGPEAVDISGREPAVIEEEEALDDSILKEATGEWHIERPDEHQTVLDRPQVVGTKRTKEQVELALQITESLFPVLHEEHGKKERFTVHNLGEDYREHLRTDFGDDQESGDQGVNGHEADRVESPTDGLDPRVAAAYQEAIDRLQARHQTAVEELGVGPHVAELIKE
jgi:hypothetical protein